MSRSSSPTVTSRQTFLLIKRYVVDDDVKEIDKKAFEPFWEAVGDLEEGEWQKYEVLPRFALSMGTKNSATGDVERSFSNMNQIHQNKQRNCMSQETLDANLHIRSGVECEKNWKSCERCEGDSYYDHCHCKLTTISEDMKSNCRKAWEKCKSAQRGASKLKEDVDQNNIDKVNKVKAAEEERIRNFKEKLTSKTAFLPLSLMKPVYEKKDTKKVSAGLADNSKKDNDGKKKKEDNKERESNKEKDNSKEKVKKASTWEKASGVQTDKTKASGFVIPRKKAVNSVPKSAKKLKTS